MNTQKHCLVRCLLAISLLSTPINQLYASERPSVDNLSSSQEAPKEENVFNEDGTKVAPKGKTDTVDFYQFFKSRKEKFKKGKSVKPKYNKLKPAPKQPKRQVRTLRLQKQLDRAAKIKAQKKQQKQLSKAKQKRFDIHLHAEPTPNNGSKPKKGDNATSSQQDSSNNPPSTQRVHQKSPSSTEETPVIDTTSLIFGFIIAAVVFLKPKPKNKRFPSTVDKKARSAYKTKNQRTKHTTSSSVR